MPSQPPRPNRFIDQYNSNMIEALALPWLLSWEDCQKWYPGISQSDWAYKVERFGKKDGAAAPIVSSATKFIEKYEAEKAEKYRAERAKVEKLVDPHTHPPNWTKLSKEHQQSLTNTEIDDDGFFYHVTPSGKAGSVCKHGVLPGQPSSMAQGSYSEYSKGKAFITDRKGAAYWQERIGDHLEYQGRPRATSVLRIPKHAVNKDDLEDDLQGTRDAYAKAYFSTKPITGAKAKGNLKPKV